MQVHILMVEDDDAARLVVGHILKKHGYRVTMAPDGEMALRLLDAHTFDVVLSDIDIGWVDGIQVVQAARSQEHPPAVVVLTGNSSPEKARAAQEQGACAFLMKPCDISTLLEHIKRAVATHDDTLCSSPSIA